MSRRSFWNTLPKPFLVLAPMEDVTDFAFREIMATRLPKPDVFFTEFTSADGLFSKGHEIVVRKFKFSKNQHPIVAQIFGTNPKTMNSAAALARDMGFDGVDINMGCPVREVANKGAGAGLIKNPSLAKEIIQAVKEGAGPLPVSVKTRIGFDSIITESWTTHLLEQHLSALIIHGRTAAQLSKVPANWEEIGTVVKIKNKIAPETIVIGNGDVTGFAMAKDMQETYQVDGIMIGRGIFWNPWAFDKTPVPSLHTQEEYVSVLLDHLRMYDKTWGKEKNFEVMKKFFKMYIKDFRGANELRQQLMECKSLSQVEDLLLHKKQERKNN